MALHTPQAPVRREGASFRTHDLVITETRIGVRTTLGLAVFVGVGCAAMGVIGPLVLLPAWRHMDVSAGMLALVWGLLLAALAWLVKRAWTERERVRIDLLSGRYRFGPGSSDRRLGPLEGPLDEVQALQVLAQHHAGSPSWISHELNLVLPTGERLNILRHGDRRAIDAQARALAQRLGLRVWTVQGVWRD